MDILILAGGRCRPDLAKASGADWRCDIPLPSGTFLDVTLRAVQDIGSPIVVGPRSVEGLRHAEPGATFVQSVGSALALAEADEAMIVTADMPWITSEALQGFLERRPNACDLAYPVVPAEDCERRFPGLPRTSVRLKEGRFTGGNIAWAKTAALRAMLPVLEKAYAFRKSPARLGAMIGWGLVARLAAARIAPSLLTIPLVEDRASRFLGISVRGVVTPFPEIGTDIDSAEQYQIMRQLMNAER